MTLGQRIKEKRKEAGLTQLDLALKMGYTSKSAISSVENDKENMSTERVEAFAKALNCNPIELFIGLDPPVLNERDIEDEIIEKWEQLTEEQQAAVMNLINLLIAENKDVIE